MKHIHTFLVICFLLFHVVTSTNIKIKSKTEVQVQSKSKVKQSYVNELVPGGVLKDEGDSELDQMESEAPGASEGSSDYKPEKEGDFESQISDWLTISSYDFRDGKKYPILVTIEDGFQEIGLAKENFQRLNFFNFKLLPPNLRPPKVNIFHVKKPEDKSTANFIPNQLKSKAPKGEDLSKKDYFWFWFRASERYLYYSSNPSLLNQLGTFNIHNIREARNIIKSKHCFEIELRSGPVYKICGINEKIKAKWFCFITRAKKVKPLDAMCGGETAAITNVINKTIIQPVMIIPTPSKHCNENWDFGKNGKDWDCKCAEGKVIILI